MIVMIPDLSTIHTLWDECNLPEYKRIHSMAVADVAMWIAGELMRKDAGIHLDLSLLTAAALLHDIDKGVPKKPGEHHPDTGVRLLREHGLNEVADLIRTHPLHAICDQSIAPKTWEQKILYLADKMVKHTVITVDERFSLWRNEELPVSAYSVLDEAYPLVKKLESEIFGLLGRLPSDASRLVSPGDWGTMGRDIYNKEDRL